MNLKAAENIMNYFTQYQRIVVTLIFFLAGFCLPLPVMAEESPAEFARSTGNYVLPDVSVVRQDGKKLSFINELNDGRPVILSFVFASCSAICPMISHTLSKVQTRLAKNGQKFHLVSISIDPENDTPAVLIEYSKKFSSGSQWDFYTGTTENSLTIQKAFDAYRGDKMNHSAAIFMRAKPNKLWLRLEGFGSPDAIIHEYQEMIKP
ncbi:MAG: SCO family protein [Methylococcales bacterium]|nr:SCO family protein [Methylococcales bacterium]